MNRQSPGIGWCDWTWNPITGCRNGCPYCYARAGYERFGRSFAPAFHPERLSAPARVKKPARIFLGSVTDFGSDGIEEAWLREVVKATRAAPWHRYIMLTKRPERLPTWLFDETWWFGVTVTKQRELPKICRLAERARNTTARKRIFASFEPLLGLLTLDHTQLDRLSWVIIGALTRGGRAVPEEEGGTKTAWSQEIDGDARGADVPVYFKDNLWPLYASTMRWPREFPEGLLV